MKKYIIYAPIYNHRSNGIKVLYKLSEELNKRGYDAYMYAAHDPKDERYKYIEADKITEKEKENDIIIYPETVSGNPLEFQNVVRWILYYPGIIGGDKKYSDYETLFTFSKKYYDTNVLYVPTIDLDIFRDNGTKKTIDSVFVHKGGKWKDIPELEHLPTITSAWPENKEDLIGLLQKTNILYSYDDCTSLLDEAVLCGCKVKIIRKDGYEDYVSKYNYEKENQEFQQEIEDFINITQNLNYKGAIDNLSIYEKIKIKILYFCSLFFKFIIQNQKISLKLLNKSQYWRTKRV